MNVRYEIHVQGLFGPVLRTAFADLQCVAVTRFTTIRAHLSADELRHLLHELDQRGVRLERVWSQPAGDNRQIAPGNRTPGSTSRPVRRGDDRDRRATHPVRRRGSS
jgi:hypothetical protein